MQLRCVADNIELAFNSSEPIEIHIPLDFSGDQPSAYGAPRAAAAPLTIGNFVGDTRRGGSCNCEIYTIVPHCNGTHTECIGHLTEERISIHAALRDSFSLGTLVTVFPESASHIADSYTPPLAAHDRVISHAALERALEKSSPSWLDALVLRTQPNGPEKKQRNYGDAAAPFFSRQAMQFISSLPVRHLIVDIPSVDRAEDDGKLSSHRLYWNMSEGARSIAAEDYSLKTITELVYVPDAVRDGRYIIQIETAPFMADASPSRVKLYEPRRVS